MELPPWSKSKMSVQLQAADGELFKVDLETVKCSGTIKDHEGKMEGTTDAIQLDKVNGRVLRKVMEWAKHHKVFYQFEKYFLCKNELLVIFN